MSIDKFKVGDKVRVRQWDDMKKEFGTLPWGTIKVRCGEWYYSDDMFEPQAQSIVIYRKDNKVIALDKATGETAEAICNADDEFDFYVGADLAFERLRGRKPAPKTREEAPEYFTGEIVCVKSECPWYTKGKIYKVKNGTWVDDAGDTHEDVVYSVEDINAGRGSKFVEIVK